MKIIINILPILVFILTNLFSAQFAIAERFIENLLCEEPPVIKVQYLTENVVRVCPDYGYVRDVELVREGMYCNFVVIAELTLLENVKIGITNFEIKLESSSGVLKERAEYAIEYDATTGYPTIYTTGGSLDYVVFKAFPRLREAGLERSELTLGTFLVSCQDQGTITIKIVVKSIKESERNANILVPSMYLGNTCAKIIIPDWIAEPSKTSDFIDDYDDHIPPSRGDWGYEKDKGRNRGYTNGKKDKKTNQERELGVRDDLKRQREDDKDNKKD